MPDGAGRIESLDMDGPAGLLEGILRLPSAPPSRAALLCHPHPLYQGSMHSPVIFRAARALQRRGYATLRFNFRGVGRSRGIHDSGRGEREDVRSALEELCRRLPGVPVTLLGYSFGSSVGFEAAAADPRIRRLIGIGLPTTLWSFDFLREIEKPLLLVQGEEDLLGPVASLRRLVEGMGGRARLVVLPGADHFLTDDLERLEEAIYTNVEEE